MICIPSEEDTVAIGSGPTPSVPELVSIAMAWSLAKLREEEVVEGSSGATG